MPTARAGHFPSNQSPWAGRAAIGLGWGYFRGSIGDNQPHQHHAMQIVLASTTLRIWLDNADWRECCGVVIGPGVAHQLAYTDEAMTMVFLEPESDQARRIANRLDNGWRELSRAEAFGLWERLERTSQHDLTQVVADLLCPATNDIGAQRDDALLRQLLHDLPRPLPEKLTAQQLAQSVHLSTSRFQHRFVQYTGMAVRPYLRWLRLLTAIEAIGRGASLTEAAVGAGFADAAHFSRTFRRHFGFAPRHLLGLHFIA